MRRVLLSLALSALVGACSDDDSKRPAARPDHGAASAATGAGSGAASKQGKVWPELEFDSGRKLVDHLQKKLRCGPHKKTGLIDCRLAFRGLAMFFDSTNHDRYRRIEVTGLGPHQSVLPAGVRCVRVIFKDLAPSAGWEVLFRDDARLEDGSDADEAKRLRTWCAGGSGPSPAGKKK